MGQYMNLIAGWRTETDNQCELQLRVLVLLSHTFPVLKLITKFDV